MLVMELSKQMKIFAVCVLLCEVDFFWAFRFRYQRFSTVQKSWNFFNNIIQVRNDNTCFISLTINAFGSQIIF